MRCSGCGKDVPFAGEVCPYCQRDKKSDQTGTVAAGIGLIIGGFIGNLVGGFGGMIVGGLLLAFIAAAVSMSGSNHSAKKPPRVRIAHASPPPAPAMKKPTPPAAADNRLRQLQSLRSDGLISEEEFEQKRASIIAAL